MAYPGIWMTESEKLLYRVVPKAACSSIGQILYYTEHGTFFDGDIHDARHGIHKWALEHSQPLISRAVENPDAYKFSCVRNPYQRILSSFFDKICGVQRSGGRYRDTLVPFLIKNYDIEVGGEDGKQSFDQVRSFRRFLLFARDTMQWHRPMAPDIHWSSIADHLSTLVVNGGRFDSIFWVERFDNGMQQVRDRVKTTHPVDLADVPRFNQSQVHGPKRAHPVADYFDDLSMHLMYEMYRRDFYLFKYDYFDPSNVMPMAEMDLDEIHAELTK